MFSFVFRRLTARGEFAHAFLHLTDSDSGVVLRVTVPALQINPTPLPSVWLRLPSNSLPLGTPRIMNYLLALILADPERLEPKRSTPMNCRCSSRVHQREDERAVV